MRPLGDSHNFGKRVSICDDGVIVKPRCIFWEWLLLSSCSTFRQFLSRLEYLHFGNAAATATLPSLGFELDDAKLDAGGRVECLSLSPMETLTNDEAQNAGRVVALLCVLGVSDLHSDNMAAGRNANGNFVFGPVDVESIFETVVLPTQTLLLPSSEIREPKSGLASLRSRINSPSLVAAFCEGFSEYVEFLETADANLTSGFVSVAASKTAPIRVIARSTKTYKDALTNHMPSDFSQEESEQLARGDIPYFFRFIGSDEIFYLRESGVAPVPTPSLHFTSAQKRLRREPQIVDANTIDTLKKAGALQLARYFTRTEYAETTAGQLTIKADARVISFVRNEVKVQCVR